MALIDDLRSRKIHNKLLLFLLPFVLLALIWLKGVAGLLTGGFSALLAFFIGIPLTLGKVIGGGDFKLLFLVAFTVSWMELLQIMLYSLPWALLLGIFKIILDKKLKDFFLNLVFFVSLPDSQRAGVSQHSFFSGSFYGLAELFNFAGAVPSRKHPMVNP